MAANARSSRTQARHVVAACYLGWTLDAFDFFLLTFVLGDIAHEFGRTRTDVTWAITLTLAARVLGAWLFGRLADRYGRRPVLMASVLSYSLLGFASGFAPSFWALLALRALFGVAMGGEWGVGASLTMESVPAHWRGRVSGLLQTGYPTGYLLAALAYGLGGEVLGWRGLLMLGAAPALVVLYIRRHVPESPGWSVRARVPVLDVLRQNLRLTLFAVALMTAFTFFSHGTQDLYPEFLKEQHKFARPTVATIAVVYNIGAIIGGLAVGAWSQRVGRRRAITTAALLALPCIPLWAFAGTPVLLAAGAFLMQVAVQGAWGVVPAHLNELSPAGIRATFPGVVYQLGNFIAASNATIQSGIADRMGGDFRYALAGTAGLVAVVIAGLVWWGPEARDAELGGVQA